MKLGVWSTVLLVPSLHGLLMAGLLARARTNRASNVALAALLAVMVLLVTPYTLGYAGAYDTWPWLTFAPFYWTLAIGPLVWLYVHQLAHSWVPKRLAWHFLPAALQGTYFSALFLLPLELRWRWNDFAHEGTVGPALRLAFVASLALYIRAAWLEYRAYQGWLEANSGAREDYRLEWLRAFLVALGIMSVALALFVATDFVGAGLNYFAEFPLYLVYAGLVYFLGLLGWRHAADRFPKADVSTPASTSKPEPSKDWPQLGGRFAAAIATQGLWKDPAVDLAAVARQLGTNTTYLSRALNEGLQMSFSDLINDLRVEAAKALLHGDQSVLDVALEVGFGSKATFNRVFRLRTGQTPSEFRSSRLKSNNSRPN